MSLLAAPMRTKEWMTPEPVGWVSMVAKTAPSMLTLVLGWVRSWTNSAVTMTEPRATAALQSASATAALMTDLLPGMIPLSLQARLCALGGCSSVKPSSHALHLHCDLLPAVRLEGLVSTNCPGRGRQQSGDL